MHCQTLLSTNLNAKHLVLVHGWAMNNRVWQVLIDALEGQFHLHLLSDDWSGDLETVLAELPEQAIWCAWSLGALLAVRVAVAFPQRVIKLITIAANPCFVAQENWPSGLTAADFSQFGQDIEQDTVQGLKRFVALQCQGSLSYKQDARYLQAKLAEQAMSTLASLQRGLGLLAQDHRDLWQQVTVPQVAILGQADRLVPVSLAEYLPSLWPTAQIVCIEHAAHVPFVSHSTQIVACLTGDSP